MTFVRDSEAWAERGSNLKCEAQYLSGLELARQLGPLLRGGEAQAFDELTFLPENMLCLLDSPEGWAALAAFIVKDERPACSYRPVRH